LHPENKAKATSKGNRKHQNLKKKRTDKEKKVVGLENDNKRLE
jgi:hypothetical protein